MIAAVVTKDFGVIASDSAHADNGVLTFDYPKLNFYSGKYLVTYVGAKAYFSKIDMSKFREDLGSLTIYLSDYLQSMKEEVGKMLKELNTDPEYQQPRLCLFVMGIYNKKPTLVQFNSFLNFKPKYLYSDDKPKFSTIFYGDDNPEKKKIFLESTSYMEKKAHKLSKKGIVLSPGVLGEILTRGIYKKVDMEMEIKPFRKYAGGVISVASLRADGQSFGLSNTIV